MDKQQLIIPLVKENSATKKLLFVALLLFFLGLLFHIALKNGYPFRNYFIAIPTGIGVLLLIITKLMDSTVKCGQMTITDDEIRIYSQIDQSVPFTTIGSIRLKMTGYEMQLKGNYSPLSKEFFPFEDGGNNRITLVLKDNTTISSAFFLKNNSTKRILIEKLTELSKTNDVELNLE